jgi:hypothetical protein
MDVAVIEADDLHVARAAPAFDGLDDADGGGFARSEHSLEPGVRGEDVFGRGAGAGAVAHAELAADEADGRELAGEGFLEAALAEARRGAARLLHDHGDTSLPFDEAADFPGGLAARGVIVGGDEGDVVFEVDGGVEDADGDARGRGPFERGDESAFLGGGDGDGVHALGDEGVDDLNLARMVGLFVRAVPEDLDAKLPGGAVDAGVNRDEKQMRGGLGDHGDPRQRGPAARG